MCRPATSMAIYDAAMRYKADGTPLVVVAGKEYGTGSSRDWAAKGTNAARRARGHRRELRAHPPLEPGRHGRAAAAVRRRRRPQDAQARRFGDLHDPRCGRTCARARTVDGRADPRRWLQGNLRDRAAGSIPSTSSNISSTAASCSTCCASWRRKGRGRRAQETAGRGLRLRPAFFVPVSRERNPLRLHRIGRSRLLV